MDEKLCGKCGEIKPLKEFSKDVSRKDGCQRQCKCCTKAYREANRDRAIEYHRKYSPKYYRENRETIIKRRSEHNNDKPRRLEYVKEWRQENPEKIRSYSAKYKALKVSTSTTDQWELAQIELFYAQCPEGYHVDHIFPLVKGGRHELSNLQHLDVILNKIKAAKHPDEWNDPRPISCRA